MIYCLLCGKECADTAKVCDNCGNPLMRAPSGEDVSAKNPGQKKEKKEKKETKEQKQESVSAKKWQIPAIAAALAAVAGLDTAKIDPAKYIVYIKDLGQSKAYIR